VGDASSTLEGKVALVTGGAVGIGASVARRLHEAGAAVAVVDVQAAPASDPEGILHVRADITDDAEIDSALQTTLDRFGGLDILVNNAGIIRFTPLQSLQRIEWDAVISTNLTAPAFCAKAALPHLVARGGGSIINISSIQAVLTGPEFAAYAASKTGLLGLTRSLALELGPLGIRVNAVLPGYVRTDLFMADADRLGDGDPQVFIERLESGIALGRIGEPDDIAGVVAFLASDQARYVTGAALAVDAGVTVRL
jgi:NAD(P)-dependent dehydrogenase (short-subunit alcohol dehydrogenase family)